MVLPQRKITSSLQSPMMSALRVGVDLLPLFDEQPSAVRMPPSSSYWRTVLLLSTSRDRSPSHQTRKLSNSGLLA